MYLWSMHLQSIGPSVYREVPVLGSVNKLGSQIYQRLSFLSYNGFFSSAQVQAVNDEGTSDPISATVTLQPGGTSSMVHLTLTVLIAVIV